MNRLPPASPARRHFMGIVAAGAGRLSTIAISSALLAALQVKNADALGTLPRVAVPIVSGAERLF